MKIGVIKKILKDDLGAGGVQLPPWLDPFLQVLNIFIDSVVGALQGRLTFADNFLCKSISQLSLTHGVSLAVNPQISTQGRNRILGLLIINVGGGNLLDKYGYSVTQSGQMGITAYFTDSSGSAVAAGTSVKCDLVILLG